MEKTSDPRILVIPERLSGVKHVVPVMSSKGGVGKTTISVLLALALAEKGYKVGLLDLDFTNPSTHIVLGADPLMIQPIEEKGIVPPLVHGVRYMTLAYYTLNNPTPLRGNAINDVFLELLAITRWGKLDYLLIDTPPGMSDPHLDLLTYLSERVEPLIVATPSPLATKSVERLLILLLEGGYAAKGLIENMSNNTYLSKLCGKYGVRHLGSIPYYRELDRLIGNVEALKNSPVYGKILGIVELMNIHE